MNAYTACETNRVIWNPWVAVRVPEVLLVHVKVPGVRPVFAGFESDQSQTESEKPGRTYIILIRT